MSPCVTHHHACDCREAQHKALEQRCERLEALLNWAETLIWNGETPPQSTRNGWNRVRHDWTAQKYAALAAPPEGLCRDMNAEQEVKP